MNNSENNKKEAVTTTASAEKNKPKKLSKGLCIGIVAIVAVISFILGMVFINIPGGNDIFSKTKVFTADEMNITLPKDFSVIENVEGFTACYGIDDMAIYINKEAFEENSDLRLLSIENYRLNLLHTKDMSYNDLKETDGIVYFTYDYLNEATGTTFTYYTFTYETSEAFWIVQFAVEKSKVTEYENNIIDWAKTISFTKASENN